MMREPVLHEIDAVVRHEVLTADHIRREFVQHFHPTYSFGVIIRGKCAFTCSNDNWIAVAGDICVIHPFEVHSASRSGNRLSYRMIYPTIDYIRRLCVSNGGMLPFFTKPIIRSQVLFEALAAALGTDVDVNSVQRQQLIDTVLKDIVVGHAHHWDRVVPPINQGGAVGRACRILESAWREEISFAKLASQVGLSKHYFSRQFKRKVGLQPRQYLRQIRLHEAKRMIREGRSLSEASIEAGFFDQPHMTREFCRVFGATPGRIQ